MKPLDEATRTKVTAALLRARGQGRDEAEYLNQYGLLASRDRQSLAHAEAVAEVIEVFERLSLVELIGNKYTSGSWTASDVVTGILDRLYRLREEARQGRWVE